MTCERFVDWCKFLDIAAFYFMFVVEIYLFNRLIYDVDYMAAVLCLLLRFLFLSSILLFDSYDICLSMQKLVKCTRPCYLTLCDLQRARKNLQFRR